MNVWLNSSYMKRVKPQLWFIKANLDHITVGRRPPHGQEGKVHKPRKVYITCIPPTKWKGPYLEAAHDEEREIEPILFVEHPSQPGTAHLCNVHGSPGQRENLNSVTDKHWSERSTHCCKKKIFQTVKKNAIKNVGSVDVIKR